MPEKLIFNNLPEKLFFGVVSIGGDKESLVIVHSNSFNTNVHAPYIATELGFVRDFCEQDVCELHDLGYTDVQYAIYEMTILETVKIH